MCIRVVRYVVESAPLFPQNRSTMSNLIKESYERWDLEVKRSKGTSFDLQVSVTSVD